MNLPAAASVVGATTGIIFAVLSVGFASAPGWKELRWFAVVAATAGAYELCDLGPSIGGPDRTLVWIAQLSQVFAALHLASWIRYVAVLSRRPNTRVEISFAVALCLLALVALVPGVLISPHVSREHTVAWLGVTYSDALPTPLGEAGYALLVSSILVPLAHFVRLWRRGVSGAPAHAIALTVLGVAAANDAFAAANVAQTPYVLSIGFLAVVVAVGGAMVQRFIASARSLEQLSTRLQRNVEAGTRELVRAQEELMRAEKLAAIGRLSAGVAHEINNPAAAIVANLGYLREQVEEHGTLPSDGLDCILESLTCTDRIAGIVRQLLSAGRVAGERKTAAPCYLARALELATMASRQALSERIVLENDILEDVCVLGEEGALGQVLVNLIVNAAHAIEEGNGTGRIRLITELSGERVLLRIADDGCGMQEGSEARIFEPFFTTKPQGKGTGLGLAVSRGLVRAFGGELSMESTSPRGTTMLLDLPRGQAPQHTDSLTRLSPPAPRYRLLVVDDDPNVRAALGRALGARYVIDVADGVTTALERVAAAPVDLVLCDVTMPDGGAPRFLRELERVAPSLAAATIFFTGGASTPASRAFAEAHADRVLEKPLDLAALRATVRRLLRETSTPDGALSLSAPGEIV